MKSQPIMEPGKSLVQFCELSCIYAAFVKQQFCIFSYSIMCIVLPR